MCVCVCVCVCDDRLPTYRCEVQGGEGGECLSLGSLLWQEGAATVLDWNQTVTTPLPIICSCILCVTVNNIENCIKNKNNNYIRRRIGERLKYFKFIK